MFDGSSWQEARVDRGDLQQSLSTVVELCGPDISAAAADMEYRQAFAGGLPRSADEIDEKPGGDGVARAERVQGRLVEWG
jgi:hypothetical protein